jgi:adenylate cyclase
MAPERYQRKLTAILSADVAGYSRLMGEDEAATLHTLNAYREIMKTLIQQHRGRLIDFTGDNLLAEFSSVVDAVQCAVSVQKELQARNAELPENRRMKFRIGINLGDVIQEGDRIYGDGVNVAARLEALADPGGICVSKTAFDQIESKLPLGYEYLGDQTVKNIAKPVGAYRVLMEPRITVAEAKRREKSIWRQRTVITGVIAILLVSITFGVWYFNYRPSFEPASLEKMAFPLPNKPSIAVLPFKNLSDDKKQDYIVDGLTENIIDALSKIEDIFVIARNSTITYRDKPVKVQQVAEGLGVRYVLEGSVQKSGEDFRVTAQLIDALKGHHVWSEKYDREIKDIFAIQDDITLNIAVAMQVKLTEGEQARGRHSTKNLEAWRLTSEGIGLHETFRMEDIAKARELFKKAVELDPNYLFAWAMLGWTYWIDGVYYSAHYDRKERFEQAAEITQRILNIDNNSSEAYTLLSCVYMSQRKFDEAVDAGRKAISLDPNNAGDLATVAIVMQNVGEFEEAIALLKRAMRLHPFYPSWYLGRLGICYRMIGRYKESVAVYKEVIKRDMEEGGPMDRNYLYLATTYSMMGRIDDARDLVRKALEYNPKMTIEAWRKRLFQYKDPAHIERILDALRKAGLPEKEALPLPDKPSIAVLPFENLSDDPKQEHFSDGLTEQIITALGTVPHLFVIARNSTFVYKGKPVKVLQIGQELGVRYVLEGSVQKAAERIRIAVKLVEAKTGEHLWAEHYDKNLDDIFAVQDEITRNILTSLQIELTEGEYARTMSRGTSNLKALECLWKAEHLYLKFIKEDNFSARQWAEKAIELDPNFAGAWALLGWIHLADGNLQWSESRARSYELAMECAEKALALDKFLPKAYGLLGSFYRSKNDYKKAITYGKRAVDLSPNDVHMIGTLAATMLRAGRFEESIALTKKAMRISPYYAAYHLGTLGRACFFERRYDEAIAAYEQLLKRCQKGECSPFWPHRYLAAIYSELGQNKQAKAHAAEVLRIRPNFKLDRYRKRLFYKDKAHKDRLLDALRKAGLK